MWGRSLFCDCRYRSLSAASARSVSRKAAVCRPSRRRRRTTYENSSATAPARASTNDVRGIGEASTRGRHRIAQSALHSAVVNMPDGGPMTYYGAQHLADSFRTVRKNTLAIADVVPEDKYGFRATPDVMSVGEMLAHLAVSPMWQMDVHRSKIDAVDFAFFSARLQQAKAAEQAMR